MLLNVVLLVSLTQSRPLTSHHVICHIIAVTCLFIANKNKNKNKINRKEILNQEK